ncbi:MAG: cell division protein FtsI [Lachnospiraceae bacterium]|jgi:stage V sporulation protein D (sporulation-specific penicillin-binding protein)|nr:cell division protein FtsI [Lachnospiraceae bacterium]
MSKKRFSKLTIKMQKKLVVLFMFILLAFIGLTYRLFTITRDNGERYKKVVLSQQRYDSKTLPFKRGTIYDANGSVLASSEKVYNVILDAVAITDEKGKYLEPTLNALRSELGIETSDVRTYIEQNSETSRYRVLARRMEYEEIQSFVELQNAEDSLIRGIWFEEEYKRVYPGNSLACDVIGFTTSDNVGSYGLEEYYNDVLSGTPGREYGYLNNDSNLERTTIPAEDGNSIVSTIDSNVQRIVEKYLKKFDDEYKDNAHDGNGSRNTGCIIMDVNSGEVIAMAGYPVYNLNDTRNTDALIGMPILDENDKVTGEYINEENLSSITSDPDVFYRHLNALWKNFCINDTYEPGSVSKPLTVAAGIESGSITGNESFNCEGKLEIGGHEIRCHNRYGDGYLTVSEAVERSCNVNMMYIAQKTGRETFLDFQHIFNIGLKTNIDLAGEARTASLVYTKDNMGPTDLATNSFGQGYNATMIEMMAAFCSLINGGYYYEPHMVSKIISPSGATVQNIEPRILKQTISETTSAKIREMCNLVVSGEHGTGVTARPAGYMIGGKTGTAETLPRGNKEYVVSFLGYAPIDDPQIAIYVVVDRPNVPGNVMDDAKFATRIVRSILTEVLPYEGIFMTEELTDKERAELDELQLEIMTPPVTEGNGEQEPQGTEGENENPEGTPEDEAEGEGAAENPPQDAASTPGIWTTFPIDPETGYAIDPETGDYVDPNTGAVLGGSYDDGVSPGGTPSPEPSATPEE